MRRGSGVGKNRGGHSILTAFCPRQALQSRNRTQLCHAGSLARSSIGGHPPPIGAPTKPTPPAYRAPEAHAPAPQHKGDGERRSRPPGERNARGGHPINAGSGPLFLVEVANAVCRDGSLRFYTFAACTVTRTMPEGTAPTPKANDWTTSDQKAAAKTENLLVIDPSRSDVRKCALPGLGRSALAHSPRIAKEKRVERLTQH